MYLALARKYRPQNFTEVLGQDVVLKTLANAIALKRVHHAYLFCGARGVGKTSLARILAKSLNCERGPTIDPCQTCPACVDITKGSAMDVIEIDAASYTGVENIRQILEEVKFLPGTGRYKVYIIDEVHMLSKSAFNALLKTLEEPPAHVIFILATTEPHKVLITILSRCQRFDFRKLPRPLLVGHMKKLLASEGVEAEDGAIEAIAECAQGSVRDALSLLDQAIGCQGGRVAEAETLSLLGIGDRALTHEALGCLARGDLNEALAALSRADEAGLDLLIFAQGLLNGYRHLLVTAETKGDPSDISPSEREFYRRLAGSAEVSSLLAQYQILFRGLDELGRAEFVNAKTALEVTFIKMGRAGRMIEVAELADYLRRRAMTTPSMPRGTGAPLPVVPKPSAPAVQFRPAKTPVFPPPPAAAEKIVSPPEKKAADWYELVRWITLVKPSLGAIISEASPCAFTDERIEVSFAPGSPSYAMMRERRAMMDELLTIHFGRKVPFIVSERGAGSSAGAATFTDEESRRIREREESARREVAEHPAVRELTDRHGAKITEVKLL